MYLTISFFFITSDFSVFLQKQYIFIHDVLKIIIDRKMKTLAGSNGVHDDSSAVVNLAFGEWQWRGDMLQMSCHTFNG